MNSYSLRTRDDGHTEVLEHAASVIGTFARPEHARQFYDWMAGMHVTVSRAPEPVVASTERPLQVETLPVERDKIAEATASGALLRASAAVASVDGSVAAGIDCYAGSSDVSGAGSVVMLRGDLVTAPDKTTVETLADEHASPAVTTLEDVPRATVEKPKAPIALRAKLADDELEAACARIEAGENLDTVARELGIAWTSLRGSYANYKRQRQAQIARSGNEHCRLCGKDFMPSISSPDTCSRCATSLER